MGISIRLYAIRDDLGYMKIAAGDRVLVLAPHIDDGELGCGGTISRFLDEGVNVFYAAFSTAEKSVPQGFPPDTLKKELSMAMGVLGIGSSNTIVHGFEVRRFSNSRQDVLDVLVDLGRTIRPNLVFMPSPNDLHQDHQVVAAEATRAFKTITLLGYEMPWNNISFNTVCFVPLDEKDIEKKVAALNCYVTQKHRTYLNPEFIRSLAIARGTQIGRRFAESFEVIRWVLE
jgi:LmbE family N-acetylglucosaminyl deacetylase